MSEITDTVEALEAQLAREQAVVEAAEAAGLPDDGPPEAATNAASRAAAKRAKATRLINEANELLADAQPETADPKNLHVENEVRQALNEFNEVYVSNADESYKYSWVFRDPHNEFGGRFVRRLQAIGWEVVSGTSKEAIEHKHVDGTRVVADCVLMRIRLDRYVVLQKRDRLLREAQQAGIYSDVYDLADRAGVRVWEDTPDFIRDELTQRADARRGRALAQFHRMNRGGGMDRMLRNGGIPGLPPGVRRIASPGRSQ